MADKQNPEDVIAAYREAHAAVYGDAALARVMLVYKHGWYRISRSENPEPDGRIPYRGHQIQAMTTNLRMEMETRTRHVSAPGRAPEEESTGR